MSRRAMTSFMVLSFNDVVVDSTATLLTSRDIWTRNGHMSAGRGAFEAKEELQPDF
jgi:hypothetical protein